MISNRCSYLPRKDVFEKRKWHLIDASNKILGRLSVEISCILLGKNKKFYSSHIDCGDFVVVINSDKIVLTGKKFYQKKYFTHSNYPGGVKIIPYSTLMLKNSKKVLFLSVKGMLPKNKLADKQIKRLKILNDDNNIHNVHFEKTIGR
ncbi:MAG: 50S ribosomal protein L13 [Endomicrobium sp.]|jgi:large subunit ribosomal protein L13|nr:50S ribosomal protein L13 [Endomicrobium sp.]